MVQVVLLPRSKTTTLVAAAAAMLADNFAAYVFLISIKNGFLSPGYGLSAIGIELTDSSSEKLSLAFN